MIADRDELKITERVEHAAPFDFNVAVCGTGPPLVLMHSLGGAWQWWLTVMPALAERYQVFAIDLPGAGKSSRVDRVPQPAEMLGALDTLYDTLGIQKGYIVGQSLGGYLALSYIMSDLAGAKRFSKAVLVAPGGVTHLRIARWIKVALRLITPLPARLFGDLVMLSYRGIIQMNNDLRRHIRASYARFDTRRSLAFQIANAHKIQPLNTLAHHFNYKYDPHTCEISVFWGSQDRVFPIRYAADLMPLLPRAQLVKFNTAGHWVQIDAPNEFTQALIRFLGDSPL